ncbi:MAG TPA: PQQ-binding-like beta-propeller repeat protein [Pirellulales bacterium]|nr:PQQ-binding-like beta-propeller repeat protein [Pirellulales bacterium]
MLRSIALLGSCLSLLVPLPAIAQDAAPAAPTAPRAATATAAPAAPTAAQTALTRAWQTRAQIDSSRGRMTHLVLQGNILFVQSDRAEVEALDAETGRSLWAVEVGRPEYPSVPLAANQQQVVVANGNTLYALDRSTGGVLWQRELKGNPSAGPAITDKRVYLPMLSGALEAYMLVPKTAVDRAPLIFFGKGASESPPIIADTRLMWGSDKGNVFIDSLASSANRVRFAAGGPVIGRLAYRTPRVFFTSLDGFVYAIDEVSGRKLWQFSLGSPIRQPPVAIGDALYVVAEAGGLWKLAGDTGLQQWFAPGITQFVSASSFRIYAADQLGQLAVLDGATGSRQGLLDANALPIKYRNRESDRIFLGTPGGYLSCFHEVGLPTPLDHTPQRAKKSDAAPKRKPAAAPMEPAAEPPVEQPGAPRADDPFAK